MELVPAKPGSLVLVQLLALVLDRGPATPRLLGRVDELFAVCGPGAGRVEDLSSFLPHDPAIQLQVPSKLPALR